MWNDDEVESSVGGGAGGGNGEKKLSSELPNVHLDHTDYFCTSEKSMERDAFD